MLEIISVRIGEGLSCDGDPINLGLVPLRHVCRHGWSRDQIPRFYRPHEYLIRAEASLLLGNTNSSKLKSLIEMNINEFYVILVCGIWKCDLDSKDFFKRKRSRSFPEFSGHCSMSQPGMVTGHQNSLLCLQNKSIETKYLRVTKLT